MAGRLFVGTSGFAYKEWRPEFYPADLKNADMLRFYASRFSSVEINNTFYRMPSEDLLARWREQTPEDFRLTMKAPQRITHIKRLADVEESLSAFLTAARALGPRLGAILFQLPPTLRVDLARLEAFCAALPGDPFRFAIEFRHTSWATEDVRALLRATGVAWCVADTDEADAQMVRTARDVAYLRLRKLDYGDDALRAWANSVRPALDDGADVYCYFKHEDDPAGVRFAARFRELIEG